MSAPLISIITITLNSERFLEQTITSVVSQTYENVEYIVVDGGSQDGTLEIIKRHESRIDKWLSEPDQGIADAMNKGLQYATGDFVLFLHSDDYLCHENVLSEAIQHMTDQADLYLFEIVLSDGDYERLCRPRGLNWWINFKTGIFHQSTICSNALFAKIGNFDTNLRIAMDYDFFLRAYRAGARSKKLNFPLSVMRLCGVSSQLDWPSLKKRFREERLVQINNSPSIPLRLMYLIFWLLYPHYRHFKFSLCTKS